MPDQLARRQPAGTRLPFKIFLSHGVTSVRDPGQWIETFEPVKKAAGAQPRCFVTGPHLDQAPPAHPKDALVIERDEEVKPAVDKFVDAGASAIKVYFRLSPARIRLACDAARARGVPVTAHLELVDADQAIRAGLSGVEHVTSFGTALAEPADADRFRASVSENNAARGKGRFDLWAGFDFDANSRLKPLIDLILKEKTFLSVTLAVFVVFAWLVLKERLAWNYAVSFGLIVLAVWFAVGFKGNSSGPTS